MDDKVQLSRETIVGDSVVNEDIYPNTDTDSVNDEQSGTNLTETIERIWAAINNKLARIVNSVNGRTGVVVLDASDVGLENVDNVSFNDIKQWVLDELTKVFGYKKIKLFDTSSDLNVCITQNNFDDLYSAFYVAKWNTTTDTRPYIGCIVLDPHDTQHLAYEVKPINGIGMTDDSLMYKDTDSDQTMPGMKGGELRVNISSDEDALYVNHDDDDPTKNGLKLDHELIGGVLHFYDGIYGDMTEDPNNPGHYTFENGLISAITPSELSPLPKCNIKIDGNSLGDFYLTDTSINVNDTIVCNFRDYRSNTGDKWTLSSEKIYIKNEKEDDEWTYKWSGDRYRVGDILDISNSNVKIKFIVTSIKDGMFEGPVSSVDLLYCEPVDDNGKLQPGLYNTKDIIRYMDPLANDTEFPQPISWDLTNSISIKGTTTAEGCKIFIADEYYWIKAQYQTPEDTDFKLMKRGMCIGRVTSAPNRLDPHKPYAIDFNSVRPLIGNSLQFKTYDVQFHSDKFSEVLDIKTRKGHFDSNGLINDPIDVSGIAIAENWGEYREDGKPARIVDHDGNSMVEPNRIKRIAVLPDGAKEVMDNSQASEGGLTVMTDMSLCIIPHKLCAANSSSTETENVSSEYAVNWSASIPYSYPIYEKELPSYVGVNILKIVKPYKKLHSDEDDLYKYRKYFFNMSGLRIIDNKTKSDFEMFGKKTDDFIIDTNNMDNSTVLNYPLSGGLMVNVGPGLEISGYYDEDENQPMKGLFDKSGKVTVRVDDKTIKINSNNRLEVKLGKGLTTYIPDPNVATDKYIMVNIDERTINYDNQKLKVSINDETYHDIDMMSNKHPVVNILKTQSPTGQYIPLSVYVDTKYGLGLTLSGNTVWDETDESGAYTGSPNALMIRIKASDVGDTTSDNKSVYRQKLVGLKTDSLMFDPDGKLISPIDTSRGLTNTYVAKAISSDSSGNVTVREEGGLAIKTGAGLTFDKDGCLTLEADYEIKAIKNGFDLNNLSSGNYYATAAVSTSLSHLPVNDVGVFRVEMKPVIPDDNYYIQKLYSFEKKGIVYIRYKVNGTWTAWYHIDGAIID